MNSESAIQNPSSEKMRPGIMNESNACSNTDAIAALAYSIWQANGCPKDTAQQDWIEAEKRINPVRVNAARAGE